MVRLGVNIDHIATIRNARGEDFPSVLEAGLIAETNGAPTFLIFSRETLNEFDVQFVMKKFLSKIHITLFN